MTWLGHIAPSSVTAATHPQVLATKKGEEPHRPPILCTNWYSSCTQLFYLLTCHSGFACFLRIRLRMNSPALSRRRSMTRFTQQVSTMHFPLEATPSWRTSLVHPQSANSPFFYLYLPYAPCLTGSASSVLTVCKAVRVDAMAVWESS